MAFWKGIGPAWLREASYTSLRLGLYAPIKHLLGTLHHNIDMILKSFNSSTDELRTLKLM